MHFNLLVRFVGRHLSDTTLKLGRSTIEPLHMNLYAIKLYDPAVPSEGPKIQGEPLCFIAVGWARNNSRYFEVGVFTNIVLLPKFGGTGGVGGGGDSPLLPVPRALHLQHAWPLTAEMAISHACMALLHIICIIYRTGKRSKIIFSVGEGGGQ